MSYPTPKQIEKLADYLLAVAVIGTWMLLAATMDAEVRQGDTRHQAGLAAELRFARAAQAMCGGENAVWELLGDGSVQCKTKRGHKTITAQVQP